MMVAVGTSSCSNSSRFGATSTFNVVTPVTLPPGRFRLATRPICTGSLAVVKTMGIVVVAAFAARCPGRIGDDHGHLTTNQLSRHRRHSVVLPLRPAIFDRHVLALDIAGFLQALTERGHHGRVPARRCAVEEPDHRHRRLLRPRRQRPRRRAAEQGDELAPPQVVELHLQPRG